jgi:hypothetical protein
MLELFTVEVLLAHEAVASFALARLGRPDLSLAVWKKWVAKGKPPIAAVRSSANCFVALFTRGPQGVAPISVAQLPGVAPEELRDLAAAKI